jgi:methionyl-tRNA synthetase
VKVPKEGYEGKVFYVWFDAPIAYLAATWEWADADPGRRDWRSWWWDAEDVDYRQFLGKDNVPFHAVSFPCTLIGSREPWKRVDVIKGVNWLVYDGGKFSTSARRGVFLDQALALLPADYWRWWLAANAPEGNDSDFTFARFAGGVNHDLADSFGNLVNRVLKLVRTRCASAVPVRGDWSEAEANLAGRLDGHLAALRRHQDACALRKAAEEVGAIWRLANTYLAAQAPWALFVAEPGRAGSVLNVAVNLVALCARIAWPFIPRGAALVFEALGEASATPPWPRSAEEALGAIEGGRRIADLPILFGKLTAEWVAERELEFAGTPE